MKTKGSFILKAGISLILCFLMLFGTVSSVVAATVDLVSTGTNRDVYFTPYHGNDGTGWHNDNVTVGARFQYDKTNNKWDSRNGEDTGRTQAGQRVYKVTVFEDYGGLDNLYFRRSDLASNTSNEQHAINGWSVTSNWSGKYYNGSSWVTLSYDSYSVRNNGSALTNLTFNSTTKKYTGSATLNKGTTYTLNIYDGGRYWANASAGTLSATDTKTMYRYGSGGSGDGIKITPAVTGTYSFEWTLNTAGSREDAGSFKVTFPTTYTVTFNANGHGTAPASQTVVSGGKATEPTAPSATGYVFGGWYKESDCTNAWDFTTDTVTKATTLYAKWTTAAPSSYTLCPDDGVAKDIASRYVPPIGVPAHYIAEIDDENYVVDSVTFTCTRSTGWTSDPDAHTITFTVSNNYPVTAHMHYHLASDPSVTGTIDSSEIIFYPGDTSKNFLGVDPSYITIDISDGPAVATVYSNVANLNGGSITLTKSGSFINISKSSITSNTETFTITPISVDSGTITVTYRNTRTSETLVTRTIHVTVVSTKRNVTVGKMLATDGTGYTTAAASEVSATLSGGGSYSHANPDTFNPTTTEVSGYKFVGWIKSADPLTSAAMDVTPVKTTLAYGDVTMTEDVETYYYALYTKIYKLSAFDSYEMQNTQVTFVTAPPKSITIKHGSTTYTYSYDGTKAKGNPDSPDVTGTKPAALPIQSGTYGQGNYIQYYAGDEITLTYSAMASSEILKGVFYNNSENFYVNKPDDNQFIEHTHPTTPAIYMNSAYYETAQLGGRTFTGVTVDNDAHSIKFIGTQDYKNIDVEIGAKRKVYFSDYTNTVIKSKNTDDYYYDNENLSVTGDQLTVKAKQSDVQTNSITATSVRYYKANADGTKGDELTADEKTALGLSITGSTSTSTSSADGEALVFNGHMPAYDLYIDLNMSNSYTLKLGTKIVSDLGGSKTRLQEAATTISIAGSTTLNANTSGDVTSGSTSVSVGSSATLTVSGLTSGYMFVGWYWGSDSAPDYEKGFISDKLTLSYSPRKGGTIWAVGTKDLFINGSKYITGKDTDWYSEGGTQKNLEMKFEASTGRYYWEITDTMFAAAGSNYKTWEENNNNTTYGTYHKGGDNCYYWYDNDDKYHGKSFFQFFDTASGNDNNKSIWNNITSFKVDTPANGPTYGKIYPSANDYGTKTWNGQGFINFNETDYTGYSSPLRIYYDPNASGNARLTVEATPIYSDIYVSNGFDVGSTLKSDATTVEPVVDGVVKTSGQSGYFSVGAGTTYSPDHEGTVTKYTPAKKGATVRITKKAGGSDKIAAFLIYDIKNKTVRAEKNITAGTAVSGKTPYYFDLTLANEKQELYIVPIIEESGAKVTITFDASQLNRKQWGDIVTAYAWYSSTNNPALGAYPGQPMIPSDDMSTWTTSFKPTEGAGDNELAGITFSNYVDGTHSWLGCTGVMGTVSDAQQISGEATGGIVNVYNHVSSGTNGEYSRTNYKAQTYDYHEPIALYYRYQNEETINISFQMKDGNSSLISWRHHEFDDNNILNLPSGWGKLNWEYLTNAKGDQYIDMNGNPLGANNKPSATFYVAAKGQVVYKTANNKPTMKYVFHGGHGYEMQGYSATYSDPASGQERGSYSKSALASGQWDSAITYDAPGVVNSGMEMKYGVQWYVYDAAGNYITTVLSAGIADLSSNEIDTYLGKQLEDMGYAVDGKSVAICYDKPRYMYGDWSNVLNSAENINCGPNFDAYRFEGQWIAAANTDTVKVNVEVAMMTDSGEVLARSNTAGYGNASAALVSGITFKAPHAITAPDGSWAQTAATDAKLNGIVLNASSQNFIGWYYYDANTGEFTEASYESNEGFRPNYSNKDVTYYAVYRASAVYNYIYRGRESNNDVSTWRVYSAAGEDLTPEEMAAGENQNKVQYNNHSADVLSKLPVGIGVFKKNIDFSSANAGSWTKNSDTQYILKLSGFEVTNPTYTLTAHYKNANGELVTISDTAEYNGKAVNLTSGTYTDSKGAIKPAGASVTSYQTGFIGWYEYNPTNGTTGDLLSTQANYGMRLTKDQHIIAVYEGSLPSDGWKAFIDENEVNKELTTKDTGVFYNDTIVRVRNGSDVKAELPTGAKIGVILVCDNKTNKTINQYSKDQLNNLVTNVQSGKTKKTASGLSITNMQAAAQTSFNRTDIAVRADYAKTLGSKYCVYAYIYDGNDYHFSAPSEVKTYE